MTTRQYLFVDYLAKGKAPRQAALAAGYSLPVLEQNLRQLLASVLIQHAICLKTAENSHERADYELILTMCRGIMANELATDQARLDAARQMASARKALQKLSLTVQPAPNIPMADIDRLPELRDIDPMPAALAQADVQAVAKENARLEKKADKAKILADQRLFNPVGVPMLAEAAVPLGVQSKKLGALVKLAKAGSPAR